MVDVFTKTIMELPESPGALLGNERIETVKGSTSVSVSTGQVAKLATDAASLALASHNGSTEAHPELSAFITAEANRAEIAANSAQLTAGIFDDVAAGLLETVDGQYFNTPSAEVKEYLILYRNDDGVETFIKSYPSVEAIKAINELIQPSTHSSQEKLYLEILDPEGGRLAHLSEKRFATESFEISSDGFAISVGDGEGGVVLYSDEARTILGALEIQITDQIGIFITDPEGGIMPGDNYEPSIVTPDADPFDGGLMFSPVIATADIFDTTLYPRNMLPDRTLSEEVVATVSSSSTAAAETGSALKISAAKYGSSAVLNFRLRSGAADRYMMKLKLVDVPVQAQQITPKILIVGDSIANRQGGTLLKKYLNQLGISPIFIGTMKGSDSPTPKGNALGELGEAREGWETGDYTNDITDRALIIQPGGESAYLAMSQSAQRDHNPFARAATADDPVSIVRKGYVFDPSFYQSRFGLETPDIILSFLGTNNVRDRKPGDIYAGVLADDTIMHSQFRAAWPNAKIIRAFPGTAYEETRNKLWKSSYLPMLRAIQKSAENLADNKFILAPLWAAMNPECGYDFTSDVVGEDGFHNATWNDSIHPYGSARNELYRALAPYVAAAALNLI